MCRVELVKLLFFFGFEFSYYLKTGRKDDDFEFEVFFISVLVINISV